LFLDRIVIAEKKILVYKYISFMRVNIYLYEHKIQIDMLTVLFDTYIAQCVG